MEGGGLAGISTIGVAGAGAWGVALANVAARAGRRVILWGRDASTLKPMLAGSDCVSIESPHPSPLSASRGFFGSRPFSRANELLAQMGSDPIDWRLP